jgi:histone-lysine N-methyltransferase SETMAR
MESFPTEQLRSYIRIRTLLGIRPVDIHGELEQACGDAAPSYSTVQTWAARFKEGRVSAEDDPRSGRPSSAITKTTVAAIRDLVLADPFLTIDEIAEEVGISHGSAHQILHDELGMRKLCSRWIPHLLSQSQKDERVETAQGLLNRFRAWGHRGVSEVVTGDETWIHYYEPKRKQQNMVWIREGDTPPTITKTERSAGKVMYAIFFSNQGPVCQVPVPAGRHVSGSYYAETILPQVLQEWSSSHPGHRLRIHHDNAPAHRSAIVLSFLEDNNILQVPHPPYSPDLAPCDFWLFPRLKDHLRGRRFESRSALGSAIYQYLKVTSKDDYDDCFKQWSERLRKCINAGGEYFEKI